MKVKIEKSTAHGTIQAPPSKSFAHRLIISAALAGGGARVRSLSYSEDILATLDCARVCFGAEFTKEGNDIVFTSSDIGIAASDALPCRESGSTMRFFIPLCLVKESKSTLTGYGRLLSRPQDIYRDMCAERGLYFEQNEKEITVRGSLKSGTFTLKGNVSSQFITGLLFALPLLDGDSEIKIIPPLESKSYIDITIEALAKFGITAVWRDEYTLFVRGNQKYIPADTVVEGDFSNAAFLSTLSYIGGDVRVTGLPERSAQGDAVYIDFFKTLEKGAATLDISDCPDLAPILMSFAAAFHGVTLTGTRRLKIKESDRGAVMAEELSKFGIKVDNGEDTIVVHKGVLGTPREELYSHNDHRIAMALSVLATLTGGTLDGAEVVKKSYPDFFDNIKKLGIEVTKID